MTHNSLEANFHMKHRCDADSKKVNTTTKQYLRMSPELNRFKCANQCAGISKDMRFG